MNGQKYINHDNISFVSKNGYVYCFTEIFDRFQ